MNLRWIPNAICIARIALVAPIVVSLLTSRFEAALILFVIAGGSDLVDGYLAKRFSWQTRLGGLLDPIADKLLISATFLTLGWLGLVPAGVVIVIVARDVVIVSGALAYNAFVAPVQGLPSPISKFNTAFQLTFVVCVLAHAAYSWPAPVFLTLLGAACVFTAIVSGLNYVLKWSSMAISHHREHGRGT